MSLNTPAAGYIRLKKVLTLVPVSKSTWWAGVKTGRFPKSYKLGPRTTGWRVEDINDLLQRFSENKFLENENPKI